MTEGDGIKAKPNVSFKHNNIGHFSNSIALCPQLSSRGQQNRVMRGCRDGMRGWLTWSQSTSRHPIPESVSDSRWALATHHTHITQRRVGLLFMHKRLYSTFMIIFLKKQWRKKVLHILWNQGGLQRVSQAKSAKKKKRRRRSTKQKKTN